MQQNKPTKRGLVLAEPTPALLSIDTTQFTRLELARILGDLETLGLIESYQDYKKLRGGRTCKISRYRLTEKAALTKPAGRVR